MVATGDPTLRLKILRNRADGFRKRSSVLYALCNVHHLRELKALDPGAFPASYLGRAHKDRHILVAAIAVWRH
jgi:hypothetical protein